MKYVNYNKKDGKILGWYDEEVHGIRIPSVPDEVDMEGNIIKKGTPERYDVSSIPKPNLPFAEAEWEVAISKNHNYVNVAKKTTGIKDFSTLADQITNKLSEISTAYKTANQADVSYMGTTFQADKKSQDLIVSVLSAGAVPTGFFWLDASNTQVPMTFKQLQGLSAAILARNQQNFIKFQGLKAKINAVKTKTALASIVW